MSATTAIWLHIASFACLVPAAMLLPVRERGGVRIPDSVFWGLCLLAMLGTGVGATILTSEGWRTGFGTTLIVSVAVTLIAFGLLSIPLKVLRDLGGLLLPYLGALAIFSAVWAGRADPSPSADYFAPPAIVALHIAIGLGAFALLTLAAVAGLAGFLQARALKNRKPTVLSSRLPSLADADALMTRLLACAMGVLGLGLVTGMVTQYRLTGYIIEFDHKTLLSLLTFCLMGGLLAARVLYGLRGRGAAQIVLLAYLLLTLAFPGVKFVTDVLIPNL